MSQKDIETLVRYIWTYLKIEKVVFAIGFLWFLPEIIECLRKIIHLLLFSWW